MPRTPLLLALVVAAAAVGVVQPLPRDGAAAPVTAQGTGLPTSAASAPSSAARSAPPSSSSASAAAAPSPSSASVDVPPRPGHIMVRPPVRQVEEATPPPAQGQARPAALQARPGPAALPPPGTISFPNERLQAAADRQDAAQDASSWASLADGCGYTKNCVGVPADCESTRTCRALATVQVVDQTFVFRLRATDSLWVAVGIGAQPKMYETSVIECVVEESGPIVAYLSYTPKNSRDCIRESQRNQAAIELRSSKSMDSGVYCEVARINRTRSNGNDFYLDDMSFYMQVASGHNFKQGGSGSGVGYHGEDRNVAGRATVLSEYILAGSLSNWPMRMHGALMVMAWMFAATSGTLAARYFKAAWGKATICGKAMWFAWHRLLVLLTLAMHAVAVVAALIYLQGWSDSSGLHGILGGVTTGLALLQGLGGLLRPGPDHAQRAVFNWAHRGMGFLTHTLAVVTIFLAVALPGARLPAYAYIILAAYVAFYVALHALHSLTEVQSYYFLIVVIGSAAFAIVMLVLVIIGPGGSF